MSRPSRRAVPKRWPRRADAGERGEALLHALRVLNFATHCGPHPSNTVWPDGKYTGFRKADYPRIRDYPSGAHSELSLVDLFQHLARKKIELNEDMQAELLQLLRSGVASNLLQSLQVVKIIEGFAKGNASARARKEMEAAIAWLRGLTDHYGMKFKAAALHRLEKALQSMAAPVAASEWSCVRTEVRAETARPAAPACPAALGAASYRRLEAPRLT